MEVLSAAASILTVLEVGYKSAVWILKTLTAMEKAPAMVGNMAADLAVLQSVFLQLKDCDMVKLDTSDCLKVAINRCTDDLQQLERCLGALTVKPHGKQTGKPWKKLWNRIQTVSREDVLKEGREKLQRHVQVLTLGLNIIQRYGGVQPNPNSFVVLQLQSTNMGGFAISQHMSSAAGQLEQLVRATMEKDELGCNLRTIHDAISAVSAAGSGRSSGLNHVLRLAQDINSISAQTSILVAEEFEVASSFRKAAATRATEFERMQHDCEMWLRAPNTRQVLQDLDSARLPGTCEWLADELGYKKWCSVESLLSRDRVLGISGKPGSGKSILASWIALDMKRCGRNHIFFSFSGVDGTRHEFGSFYRSAISQIMKLPAFAQGYQILQRAIIQGQPSTLDLRDCLLRIADISDSPLYWIVDGVDEAAHTTDDFWHYTRLLMQKCPHSRLVALGRPHSFGSAFPSRQIISLSADTVRHDIMAFARAQTSQIPLLDGSDLLYMALEAAVDMSDGMFLWTKLLLDDVARCGSVRQLKERLGRLPRGIDAMYQETFSQISDRHKDDSTSQQRVQFIFRIVAGARRPMTVHELQRAQALAFITALDPEESECEDEGEDLNSLDHRLVEDYLLDQPEKRILELCSPLVVINQGVVSLLHSSVKEFLDSQGKSQPSGPGIPNVLNSDHHLALICLESLLLRDTLESAAAPERSGPHGNSQDGADPFHEYAYRYLGYHVAHSLDSLLQMGENSSLYRFFTTGGILSWFEECLLLSGKDGSVIVELWDVLEELLLEDTESDSESDLETGYVEPEPDAEGEDVSGPSRLLTIAREVVQQGLQERGRVLGADHWRTQLVQLVWDVVFDTSDSSDTSSVDGEITGTPGLNTPRTPPPPTSSSSPPAHPDSDQRTTNSDATEGQGKPPGTEAKGASTGIHKSKVYRLMQRLASVATTISQKMPVGLLYFIARVLSAFGLVGDGIRVLELCLERVGNKDSEKQRRFRFEILDLLGQLYYQVERFKDAERVFRLSLEIKRAMGGIIEDGAVLRTLTWMMEILDRRGDHTEAIRLSSDTVTAIKSPTARPEVLTIGAMHAAALIRIGRSEDAELLLRDVILHRKANQESLKEAYRTIESMKRQFPGKAASLFGQLATARFRTLGPRHNDTLLALIKQAQTLIRLNREEECKAVCRQLHAVQATKHGHMRPDVKAWIDVRIEKRSNGRETCAFEYCGYKLGIGAGTIPLWSRRMVHEDNGDEKSGPSWVVTPSTATCAINDQPDPPRPVVPETADAAPLGSEDIVQDTPPEGLVASRRMMFVEAVETGAMPLCGRNNPDALFHVAGTYV
ncbi:hypothetical protein OQA88_13483 [Cercophora sp. LCS_1]